jgi:predicted GH43/DUF377 family glycosyl hydrolase
VLVRRLHCTVEDRREVVCEDGRHREREEAALLDLERPWQVVARARDYLLAPHVAYERVGDVPNVVFPCSAIVDRAADHVTIYYGAADTVVCLAHGRLSEIVEFVKRPARRREDLPVR